MWSNHLVLLLRGSLVALYFRLHRSLYGLKQSPRAWLGKFSTVIQQVGMTVELITRCFITILHKVDVSIWLFTLMILLSPVMFKMKYALDILEETGMVGCRPIDTPMDQNVERTPGQGEPLRNPERYR